MRASLPPVCLRLAVFAFAQAQAQDPPAPAPPQAETPPPDRSAPSEPRPYERVITKDATSDEGIFTVHRVGERLYYEIPAAQLNKEFLWVSQIARTTLGVRPGRATARQPSRQMGTAG